jgi:hypothetical protein
MNAGTIPPAGMFVRIPLANGSFGYGRALADPYMAFYDYNTKIPVDDIDEIGAKPILFRQAVRLTRSSSKWTQLGQRNLDEEAAEPVVRFMQDLADFRKCTIFDSAGMRRDVGPEECIGLERAAVWEAHHIEQRLLDHFLGRPNVVVEEMRVRLS